MRAFWLKLRDLTSAIHLVPRVIAHARGSSRGSVAFRGIFTGGGGRVVATITSLVSFPLLINYLGQEGFGIYITISSVVGWLQMGNLGFGLALLNLLAEAVGQNDTSAQRKLVVTTQFSLFFICSVMLLGWCGIFLFNLISWPSFFNAQASVYSTQIQAATFWAGAIVIVTILNGYVQSIYGANQWGDRFGLWYIASQLAGFCGMLLAVVFKLGLVGLILGVTGLPALVIFACGIGLMFKYPDQYLPRPSGFSPGVLRSVIKYGSAFFFTQIAATMQYSLDNFIISRTIGPAAVTPYAIAMKPFNLYLTFNGVAITPYWAAFGHAKGSSDWAWVRKNIGRLRILTLGSYAVFFLFMMVAGQTVIRLWVGAQAVPSMVLLGLVGIYVFVRVWTDLYSIVCNGLNIIVKTAILNIPQGILSATCMYFFTSVWGVNGLVLGSTASMLMLAAWVGPYLVRKEIEKHVA